MISAAKREVKFKHTVVNAPPDTSSAIMYETVAKKW
jgi:hypothetical protein